jgi:16S rRNA (adenine1518-N6/adenine1519-N6)-dimethyltransferase
MTAPTDDLRARIAALPPLRAVVAAGGLGARKSLGQHFLFDLNLTEKIARAAGPLEGRDVIEIGPGPGGLTRALAGSPARRVAAIERDARFVSALEPLVGLAGGRLTLVEGDALALDPAAFTQAPRKIVANLPYNIATPLILQWLAQGAAYESLTLLVQREVAERLAAEPGGKDYGRLSVMAQFRADVEMLFDIPAAAFTPPPKVVSTLVQLTPRPARPGDPAAESLERVTAAAFGQRRKMLRQSLKSLGGDTPALIEAAGLDPTQRAETVPLEGFIRLARLIGG